MNEKLPVQQKIISKLQQAKKNTGKLDHFASEFLNNFLSKATKTAYMKDLNIFFTFLKEANESIGHPRDIKAYHFQIYRDTMMEKGLSPATIGRRLVSIRSFIKWAIASQHISFNPLDAVKLPKTETLSPTLAFDDHEVIKMINAPDINTQKGNVHRIVLVMLFNLGLRRSELVKVKFKDIFKDRSHIIIKIIGKRNKERYLPLNQNVLHEIHQYQERFEQLNSLQLDKNDYIVQSKIKTLNKAPSDGSTIYRIVNRYAKQLGIFKRVGPHSCRATVISHLLDTQMTPIRDVSHFAGHASIDVTERYDKKRKGLDGSAAYSVEYKKTS